MYETDHEHDRCKVPMAWLCKFVVRCIYGDQFFPLEIIEKDGTYGCKLQLSVTCKPPRYDNEHRVDAEVEKG